MMLMLENGAWSEPLGQNHAPEPCIAPRSKQHKSLLSSLSQREGRPAFSLEWLPPFAKGGRGDFAVRHCSTMYPRQEG